ncbi:double-cubane-cluster-containing anaerobic reductase [Mailhella massiliensis]|uniref:2-hydroxyacyl-CoA dehydratase family protein n=1 Tax=Mailhella massiliensis TaxID=1903261 RepID=A0A921DSE6_9BACT|nr:double-cubane-cluster-containing anaerobic reductase [Mailhella massiliensis]HJD98061.1 2-hydroxyacyl-CoA dehydratase family protein [Mailhella massiliensis]
MNYASLDRFYEVTDKNVLALQEAKAAGKKVVGQYCIYSPLEIPLAAGAVPVSLCGTKNDSIPPAEAVLPRSLCPLIKSSFGFALQDSCPYLAASDIVVADTTCDGKKKMYELLGKYKPVMLLQLPHVQDGDALSYWRGQYGKLQERLEKDLGTTITPLKLKEAMRLCNRLRLALKEVLDLARLDPSPLNGMQMLNICFRASFMPDYEQAIAMLQDIAAEVKASCIKAPRDEARIIVTGVPAGMGSHKVIQLLEDCGACVVCLDNCSGYKKVRLMIDEEADPLTALAKRYLDTPCAVMSPNPNRYAVLEQLVENFKAHAVVDLTWQGCQTYDVESFSLKKFIREELDIPFLQIVTDYSPADTEQLKVRVEAFLEMIR